VVTHPASSLVQDRESSPVETSIPTTMLRRGISSNTGMHVVKWRRFRTDARSIVQ